MRIHDDVETVALGYPQNLDCVGNEVLVVAARACGLDGLPGEDISDGVVAPATQAREVRVGIGDGERSRVKLDVVAVEEVLLDVGGLVWLAGQFGVASDIDAAQDDGATLSVAELAVLDSQPKLRHGSGSRCDKWSMVRGVGMRQVGGRVQVGNGALRVGDDTVVAVVFVSRSRIRVGSRVGAFALSASTMTSWEPCPQADEVMTRQGFAWAKIVSAQWAEFPRSWNG